ncbi:hypothetical protein BS636_02990 [Acinetobacter sp. LoGeW2-3]|uniref:hypothetical protein n=1 Tax=Acinetobacter sp. LoGeW2-3 TaxID=1808001 RepID=UPI000C05C336|nr:hypothetical protein [Acinetobacter sp. LoGeW2-3]ATO18699.1 hypothetical protein BS636_02990 [Acinetobacter sp. LoGeW2-3]
MNKIIFAALASLVVGLGSASVYAGDDHGKGPNKPHKPGKSSCGDKCDGKIKILLDVPRHCDLDILDETLTLTERNGNWTDTGSFTVRTNAPYRLDISAPRNLTGPAGARVPVDVTTRQAGARGEVRGNTTFASTRNADQRFNVTATVSGTNYAEADAGLYSGIYTVAVRF